MKFSNLILLMILLVGTILITINITRGTLKCPAPKVINKYVPRSLKEEQEDPVPIMDIFNTMFENPSPWVGSFTNSEEFYKDK